MTSQNKLLTLLMGDSIVQGWSLADRAFFEGTNYINKGVGGQTTPQMRERFIRDVVALKPEIVVILAGTNDIAGNTGPISLETTLHNIVAMAEMAKINDIKVILGSVLPAIGYPWKPGMQPAQNIVALNEAIESYAQSNDIVFADFYSATVDERNGLKPEFSGDGVHPNKKGYRAMAPVLEQAIQKTVAR